MSGKLILPSHDDENQFEQLLFGSVMFLGEELFKLYDSKFNPINGPKWYVDLGKRRDQGPYNPNDPSWVLKEPLFYPDSLTRLVLPKTKKFFDSLNNILTIRNDLMHNQLKVTLKDTITIVGIFVEISESIPLKVCASEFQKAAEHLIRLQSGNTYEYNYQLLTEQQRALEEKSAELEEEKNIQKILLREKDLLLSEAMQQVSSKELEILEISNKLGKKDKLVKKLDVEKNKLEEKIRKLTEEIKTTKQEFEEKESYELLIEKLILLGNLNLRSELEDHINSGPSEHSLTPGDIWPFEEKGDWRLTLSPASRQIYDTKSNESLQDKFGEVVGPLAADWLKIKPGGGRVFVDSYGNAVGFHGDKLIYLGSAKAIMPPSRPRVPLRRRVNF